MPQQSCAQSLARRLLGQWRQRRTQRQRPAYGVVVPLPRPAVTDQDRLERAARAEDAALARLLDLHRHRVPPATIAAVLNAEGHVAPTGFPWHRTSVERAVRDAAYPSLAPGERAPDPAD